MADQNITLIGLDGRVTRKFKDIGGGNHAEVVTPGMSLWTQIGAHIYDATVSGATTLTPESGATAVILQTATQNIYVTVDGTTPSATNGFLLTPDMGACLFPLQGANAVKVIEAAASAVVRGAWVA